MSLTAIEVSSGWQPLRFDAICSKRSEGYQPVDGGTQPYIGLEHIQQGLPALESVGTESDVSSGKSKFETKDVLFGKLRPYLRKAVIPGFAGVCSTDILVFTALEDTVPEYLLNLCHSDQFIKHAKATTTGVQHPRTSWPSLAEFQWNVPGKDEQRQIARVLATVQQAIAQQQAIIATTRELKRGLMHKLFTEGLRGAAQKPTEIGLVPESWEVMPLGGCALVQTGIAKGRRYPERTPVIAVPYLRVANVQAGKLDLSEMKQITIAERELQRFSLMENDVVLTEGGDFDKLGRGFIWRNEIEQCVHQNHVFAVRVNADRLDPLFFAYQSQSAYGRTYFLSVAHKTTNLACINTTKLKAFPTLVPTLVEQQEIATTLAVVDDKLALAERKRLHYEDLFKTLLHQLMSAQLRVHELDLDALGVPALD